MSMTLKSARVNKNMTQLEAARSLGISVECLSNYERGKTFPDVPMIKKMEVLYSVEYKDLNFLPVKLTTSDLSG